MERPEWEEHGGGMEEKVCLITGAISGTGKATAMGLANMGASVVMVGRDRGRGEAAMAEIKEKSPNASVDLMLADLSPQGQIRRLAEEFKEAYPRLEVLAHKQRRDLPQQADYYRRWDRDDVRGKPPGLLLANQPAPRRARGKRPVQDRLRQFGGPEQRDHRLR